MTTYILVPHPNKNHLYEFAVAEDGGEHQIFFVNLYENGGSLPRQIEINEVPDAILAKLVEQL